MGKRKKKIGDSAPELFLPVEGAGPASERDLWRAGYAVLAKAVVDRKPDALARIKAEVARLDGQMSAVVNRREIAAKSDSAMVAPCSREIEELHSRMKLTARLLRQASKPKGLLRDEGPTPETAMKPASRDIVHLLEYAADGKGISHEQARAARTIAEINEAIAAAGQMKAVNIEGIGGGGGGGFRDVVISGRLDDLRSRKYLPWCEKMNSSESTRVALDIVIKVAVYNVSLRALEQRHRLRHGVGIDKLCEGLDAFIAQAWVRAAGGAVTVAQMDS